MAAGVIGLAADQGAFELKLELTIRLKALGWTVRDFGALVIDLPKYKVTVGRKTAVLTAIEFAILEFLSRSPGRVYTRGQILDNVWKEGKSIIDRAVDVHIMNLRTKLGRVGDRIRNIRGVGYKFQ